MLILNLQKLLYKAMKTRKWYHASRLHFKVGDIIEPKNYGDNRVFVTKSPEPHFTLFDFGTRSIGFDKYRLYVVRPLNPKTKIYAGTWSESIIMGAVEVVECLGDVAKSGNSSLVEMIDGKLKGLKYSKLNRKVEIDKFTKKNRKKHKKTVGEYYYGKR